MKTIYLLIGLPGAGKSTFASTILKNAKTIELDTVRQSLADTCVIGKKYSTADNEIVFKHFDNEILKAIENTDESNKLCVKEESLEYSHEEEKDHILQKVIKRY